MNLANVGDHPPTKLMRKIAATLDVPEPANGSLLLIGLIGILLLAVRRRQMNA
jgi:hypothetical protein